MPSGDVVMAVFGRLSDENVNDPPVLVISYDIRDAFRGEVMTFDASCSTDPDGTDLLFHWDFTDDGEPGPWVPGTVVPHVFESRGVHRVVLRAIDGENVHYKEENVTIRAEREYSPGPWDNPGALFLLASLMVIAFGLAMAYRLHRPRTYDDLYGKAYRRRDEDEYSQLFRKLTEEELIGHPSEGNAAGEDAPGEDAPGEDAPGEDAPGEDAPGEDAPDDDVPGEDAPGEEGPPGEVDDGEEGEDPGRGPSP